MTRPGSQFIRIALLLMVLWAAGLKWTGALAVPSRSVLESQRRCGADRADAFTTTTRSGLAPPQPRSVPVIAGKPDSKAVIQSWAAILSRMPLTPAVTELNRTNAVKVMLEAFQSNAVVKALIFLPGAADEFYMFRRARASLHTTSPTLFDAVAALTNQTKIRVAFQPPFLLLRGDSDPIEPEVHASSAAVAIDLQKHSHLPHLQFNDTEWDLIQPLLKKKLGGDVRPWRYSSDSYHFYRSAMAGWNLTDFEVLQAISLASKTRVTIQKRSFLGYSELATRFENDLRMP